jgi:hypothetical protein
MVLILSLLLGSFRVGVSPPIPQHVECIEFNETTYSDNVGWPIKIKQLVFYNKGRVIHYIQFWGEKVDDSMLPTPAANGTWHYRVDERFVVIASDYIHTKTETDPEVEDAYYFDRSQREGIVGQPSFGFSVLP